MWKARARTSLTCRARYYEAVRETESYRIVSALPSIQNDIDVNNVKWRRGRSDISSRQGRKSVGAERSKMSREKRLRSIARFEFSECDPDALGTTSASKLAERLCFDAESFPLSGTVRCEDFEEFFVSFKSSTMGSTDVARRVRSRRLMLELKWTLNPKLRRLAVYSLRVRERSRAFVQALTAMESGNDWVDAVL